MSRIASTVLIMLILLNGTVTMMEGSGLSEDLGVELAPGISDTMDDVVDHAKKGFSADAGLGETLFNLFVAALGVGRFIVESTYAAPSMLLNLGFPSWVVLPLFAPMYVIGLMELVYAATGRDLL